VYLNEEYRYCHYLYNFLIWKRHFLKLTILPSFY